MTKVAKPPPKPSSLRKKTTKAHAVAQTTRQMVVSAQHQLVRPIGHDRRFPGQTRPDPQFDLEVEFARAYGVDEGKSYGNPLDAVSNKPHFVRLRLRQHEANVVQGVKLHWLEPAGWTWIDEAGTADGVRYTIEECNSNPLVVTRVVRSPIEDELERVSFVVTVVDYTLRSGANRPPIQEGNPPKGSGTVFPVDTPGGG